MIGTISRFWSDDRAATAIEYGLIAALVAVALITAFIAFGTSLTGLFGYVDSKASNAMNATG